VCSRDGNRAVLGRSSADFRSSRFGFNSPPWFSGSGTLIGFGFGLRFLPADAQWRSKIEHLNKKTHVFLLIYCLYKL
jgi:hypothetical protein